LTRSANVLPSSASANEIASVYASSPEAQPVDQILIPRSFDSSTIRGTISARTYSQAGTSRKKAVTLMRIVLKRSTNSSGCSPRYVR
jgi:hypothetical protein